MKERGLLHPYPSPCSWLLVCSLGSQLPHQPPSSPSLTFISDLLLPYTQCLPTLSCVTPSSFPDTKFVARSCLSSILCFLSASIPPCTQPTLTTPRPSPHCFSIHNLSRSCNGGFADSLERSQVRRCTIALSDAPNWYPAEIWTKVFLVPNTPLRKGLFSAKFTDLTGMRDFWKILYYGRQRGFFFIFPFFYFQCLFSCFAFFLPVLCCL